MRYTREQACLAWLAQGMLGSRRLKKLLDDLLEASKATTGNLEVHPEVCDVSMPFSATTAHPCRTGFRITACHCCGQARRERNCMICS